MGRSLETLQPAAGSPQFAQTCQCLHAVFRQLEAMLPPGIEGLETVRNLQAELEGRPVRGHYSPTSPRAKSA